MGVMGLSSLERGATARDRADGAHERGAGARRPEDTPLAARGETPGAVKVL